MEAKLIIPQEMIDQITEGIVAKLLPYLRQPEAEANRIMGYDELAKYLNVKKSWLTHAVMKNQIPFFKVGRLVRFDLNEILKWLHRQKMPMINPSKTELKCLTKR